MNQIKRAPYVKSLPLISQGKVRDMHNLPHPDLMLMVATDTISSHNIEHQSLIPLKGQVLTAMSVFSSRNILSGISDHIVASGKDIYSYFNKTDEDPDDLHLRALVVQKVKVIPVEFIRREYMAGSLYKDFYSKGIPNPYHLDLPEGFTLMSRFYKPIFTPTEKSDKDTPLDSRTVEFLLPEATKLSRLVYDLGRAHATGCGGIKIIDFKCEVGIAPSGELLLIDEWLNGDCCRFVKRESIQEGVEPEWMDKQIVRNYVEGVWEKEGKGKHPLILPDDVVKKTADAYHELFERWTGKTLSGFQKHDL